MAEVGEEHIVHSNCYVLHWLHSWQTDFQLKAVVEKRSLTRRVNLCLTRDKPGDGLMVTRYNKFIQLSFLAIEAKLCLVYAKRYTPGEEHHVGPQHDMNTGEG